MDAYIPLKLFFLLFLGGLSRSGKAGAAPAGLAVDDPAKMADAVPAGMAVTEGAVMDGADTVSAPVEGAEGTGSGGTTMAETPASGVPTTGDVPQSATPDTIIAEAIGILDGLLGHTDQPSAAPMEDTLVGAVGDLVTGIADTLDPHSGLAPQKEGEDADPTSPLPPEGNSASETERGTGSSLLDDVLEQTEAVIADLGVSVDLSLAIPPVDLLDGGDYAETPAYDSDENVEGHAIEGSYAPSDPVDVVVDAGLSVVTDLGDLLLEAPKEDILDVATDVTASLAGAGYADGSVIETSLDLDLAARLDDQLDLLGKDNGETAAALDLGLEIGLDDVATPPDILSELAKNDAGEAAIDGDLELDLGIAGLLDVEASLALDLDFDLESGEVANLLDLKGADPVTAVDADQPIVDLSLGLDLGLFTEVAGEADAVDHGDDGLFAELAAAVVEADAEATVSLTDPVTLDLASIFGLNDLPLIPMGDCDPYQDDAEEADHALLFFL